MKKRFVAAALVVFCSLAVIGLSDRGAVKAQAAQTFEKVDFISGVVTANELNLREGPSLDHEILGVFKRYKWVNVLAEIDGWYVVFDPDTGKVGCVKKEYLTDASKIDQGEIAKNNPNVPIVTATPAPAATATPVPNTSATPAPNENQSGDLSSEETQLLNLINEQRAQQKLSALQADTELMKVARLKAQDMVQNNYFDHISPTYGSPFDMMRQFGISFKAAAVNIAGNSSVQGAVTAWMKSSGHKANILNGTYNYTGIGIAKSNKYGYVYVQMFIKK